MRCSKARSLITKRLYETLTPEEGTLLQGHLGGCPACRREQDREHSFEQDLYRLRGAAPEPAAPGVDLDSIFYPAPATGWPVSRRLAWSAVGVLAAAGGAWIATRPVQHPGGGPVARTPAATRQTRRAPIANATIPQKRPEMPPVREERRRVLPAPAPASSRPAFAVAGTSRLPEAVKVPRLAPAHPQDDADYLDGRSMVLGWAGGSREEQHRLKEILNSLPPVADDFVFVPLPRLADAASGSTAADAAEKYKKEAAVVDPRLFQKLSLKLKGASLEEFCAELERQTRVTLRASRGVQDEKVTVLVKERPAREVMREVSRLFGFLWVRSGEEGAYKYELVQDLRSQLAEQEMRNRDLNAALLALDEKMASYQPYLNLTREQIFQKLQNAQGPERATLQKFIGPDWGGMQLYHRLVPAERAALLAGQSLKYDTASARPDRRLPDEWLKPLIRAFGDQAMAWSDQENNLIVGPKSFLQSQGLNPTSIVDWPGVSAQVSLNINHSELGEVALQSESGYVAPYKDRTPGIGARSVLATAQSPSVARPNNAGANAKERAYPPFAAVVSLHPEPSCPVWQAAEKARKEGRMPDAPMPPLPGRSYHSSEFQRLERSRRLGEAHLNTADVWEEIHRKTGLPIVADYYSRLYPVPPLTLEKKTVFEALCKTGDELGAHWKRDGEYLLCRSTSFFWDKQKEVPNRLLERWTRDAKEQGGLPFADLLEITSLTDQQLDSRRVADAVSHCWGLKEWYLMDPEPGYYPARPWLRFLAELPASYRDRARSTEGLPIGQLPAAQLQEAAKIMGERLRGNLPEGLQFLSGSRVRVNYAPAAWFTWTPVVGPTLDQMRAEGLPLVSAPVRKDALAAAQRLEPGASDQDIAPTEGQLWVTLLPPGGGRPWSVGRQRPIQFQLPQ